ncbi:MAG TPA: WecB/TagA/CpsF family glycosyltransferase, partial [Arthrobacter sp.]|nr:WecB/TagA/CpsF family glycosyltransferase [Arthrobacter sp.]
MTLSGSLRNFVQPAALLRPAHQRPVPIREAPPGTPRDASEWVNLGGVPVKLLDFDEALETIVERATCGGPLPLAVASANLDHVKHFGQGSRWAGTLEHEASVEWLSLLDGAPLVSQAERITRRPWPRLAGSDLIWPLLDAAETAGLRVGFVGGTPEVHSLVREKFATAHPGLTVAGWWAPERGSLADPAASQALAAEILASKSDILVVCLGKPRQELWMSEYGHLTGAKVMLAFGAVVDFLAGRVRRAPAHVRNLGMEWAWRLALEPRRLANRYLVDGPEAFLKLRRFSGPGRPDEAGALRPDSQAHVQPQKADDAPGRPEGFAPLADHTDVAVLVVTYNSQDDIPVLLESLREETHDQSIKVIVADNSPTPSTLLALADHPDVFAFATGGNLGYSGGINAAIEQAGTADAYLVLNPDMRVQRGSVRALRERMDTSGAAVVVPLLLDADGSTYPSLRREPSVSRAFGDAVMGSKLPGRPGWLSEMDFDPESYLHAHMVDWATGAALLIRPDVAELVGEWDEDYFLYSEETDFLHRVRGAGGDVWFEPKARMTHCRGGSGTSPALDALMATNRIRYIRKYHTG